MAPLGGFGVSAAAAFLAAAAAVGGALAAAGQGLYPAYSVTQERVAGGAPLLSGYGDVAQGMPLSVPYYPSAAGVAMEGSPLESAAPTPTEDPAAAVIQAVRGRRRLQKMILQSLAFVMALYLLAKLTGRGKKAEKEKPKQEKPPKPKEQPKEQPKPEPKEPEKPKKAESTPAKAPGGLLSWLTRQSAEETKQEADKGSS